MNNLQPVASTSNSRRPGGVQQQLQQQPPQQQQQQQQQQQTGPPTPNGVSSPGFAAFSVHQPYSSWPHQHLPASSVSPYATPWYQIATAFNQQQSYKDGWTQTPTLDVLLDYERKSAAAMADAARIQKEMQAKQKRQQSPAKYRKYWDAALWRFLDRAGLHQAKRGFEADMIVMNETWEKENVPPELDKLIKDLTAFLNPKKEEEEPEGPLKSLEERKAEYLRSPNGVDAQAPTTVTKSISRFIAESRKRNNASNKAEFLLSLAEKRQKLNEAGEASVQSAEMSSNESTVSSCARVDAKPLNRDVQMKYDIAKNEDGPLKRTMKGKVDAAMAPQLSVASGSAKGKEKAGFVGPAGSDGTKQVVTMERHPGLAERFANIESHLAVRYVPAPPRSLLDRIRFLEDHIIKLEKDNPPWAALHFNQPRRGWPPPPRPTPIIVPTRLTATYDELAADSAASATLSAPFSMSASPQMYGANNPFGSSANAPSMFASSSHQPQTAAPSKRRAKPKAGPSSLHRAVLEKLEVKKAMEDLAGQRSPT